MNLKNPQNLIHPEDHTCSQDDRKFAQMMLEPRIVLGASPVCEEFATLCDDSPVLFEAGQLVAEGAIAERKAAAAQRRQERDERKTRERADHENAAKANAEATVAVATVAQPVRLRLIETPEEARMRREAEAEKQEKADAKNREKWEKKEAEQRAMEAQNAADFEATLQTFLSGEPISLDMRTHDPKQPFHCHVGNEDGTLCDRVSRGLARPNGGFIVTDDELTGAQVVLDVCGFHFKAADEARVRIMKEHPELRRGYITLEDLGLVAAFLDDGLRGLRRLRDQRRNRRGPQGPGGGQRGPKQEAKPKEESDNKKDPTKAEAPKPPRPEDVARELAGAEETVESKRGVSSEAQAEIDALNAPKAKPRDPSKTTLGEALAAKLGLKVAADGETVEA